MSRTVSARIPTETHEELRERCNKAGCTMNEWIEHAIEFFIKGSTEFDFGDEEESDETNQKDVIEKSKIEENRHEIPEVKPSRVSYDGGKTWNNLD